MYIIAKWNMKNKNYTGLFIAFEGLDGSGASIQASLLSGMLKKTGYRVELTKEPTHNLIGGLIKAQLTGEWKTSQECLQLLFASDRAQHLQNLIIPSLENGKIVITDRYVLSSIAYGSTNSSDIKWLRNVNDIFILPDITFLVKVSPKICSMRLRKTKYEMGLYNQEDKLKKVWDIYDKLSKIYKNIYVIDGERDEVEIINEINNILYKKLGINKKLDKY
jgi:dTMP kinase